MRVAAAIALAASLALAGCFEGGDGKDPRSTAAPSTTDLMQPGPLEDMALGDANAPVTIIEYASMTCPHCAHFEETTYVELKKRYIDTGKVRLIFREFPLDPVAAAASALARCAGKDKYFAVIEILFERQRDWAVQQNPIPPLLNIAKQLGFTKQSFEQCLSDQKLLDGIEAVRRRAADKLGVNSTPTFFINGKMHHGDLTIDEVDRAVQP
jgi:protein-disulfide isomerase